MGTRTSRTATVAGAALAASVLLLSACTSTPKPTQVTGSIAATAKVNPSVTKRPSPVLVRVYELKSTNAFNAADFISLYQNDQTALGTEMVAREEMTLAPGESRPLKRTLSLETRYIAVFAAYRDLEHARWRAVLAIPPGTKKQNVLIQADELAVSATLAP